jgi:hypothetical protein
MTTESPGLRRDFSRVSRREAEQLRTKRMNMFRPGISVDYDMTFEHTIPELVYECEVSPYAVYSLLRSHFGKPTWQTKSQYYDKVHWEYALRGKGSVLRVFDLKLFGWYIQILDGDPKRATIDARLLLSYIIAYAKHARIPIKNAKYRLIENVFFKNYSRGNECLDMLKKDPAKTHESLVSWAAVLAYVLSVEALLNVVYEIYLNGIIQENSDLCEHIDRLSPLDKWCLASQLCTCFRRPLKKDTDAYTRLKWLWKFRIQLTHSKITEDMKIYFLRQDGLPFATSRFAVGNVTRDAFYYGTVPMWFVEKTKADVELILSELTSNLDPNLQKTFSESIMREDISFDPVKKRLASPGHDYWH